MYNLTKQTLGPNLTLHTNTPVTNIAPIPTESGSSRRWNLTTPRGPVACSYVLHATNAYASHLLPHMHGPSGIIPTRGQIIALRAAAPLAEITKSSWDGNDGFEYWFPRPVTGNEPEPLVILGGGRESTKPKFELYTVDDATVNPVVGDTLRRFLPAAFPGKYEPGREPEMKWVSINRLLLCFGCSELGGTHFSSQTGIMGYTKTRDPFVSPSSVCLATIATHRIHDRLAPSLTPPSLMHTRASTSRPGSLGTVCLARMDGESSALRVYRS